MIGSGNVGTRYFEHRFQRNALKITQGEFGTGDASEVLVTTLGSCVAACVRDPAAGIGGMNHFMLPDPPNDGSPVDSARYGVNAMELLINALMKMGANRQRLQAKVFGAASLIGGDVMRVGWRNASFVRAFLHHEGIPLVGEDLAGEAARKIYFFPDTGRVLVRYLRYLRNTTLLDRDQNYHARLQEARAEPPDLF